MKEECSNGCGYANLIKLDDCFGTPLPRLWEVFETVASVSISNEGYFSLSSMGDYLKDCPPLNISHSEFWSIMATFLSKTNERVTLDKKRNRNKGAG